MKNYIYRLFIIFVLFIGFVQCLNSSTKDNNVSGQKSVDEVNSDDYWKIRMSEKAIELQMHSDSTIQWSEIELKKGGQLDAAAEINTIHFYQTLKTAKGNCNDLSVDTELLMSALTVRVHQAAWNHSNISAALQLLTESLACDRIRVQVAYQAILLAKHQSRFSKVREFLDNFQEVLLNDLAVSHFDPRSRYNYEAQCKIIEDDNFYDLPKTLLTLKEISDINMDSVSSSKWLRDYADWQMCDHLDSAGSLSSSPQFAYEIYKSLKSRDDMSIAALKAGDEIARIYLYGSSDRESSIESDRLLAFEWYSRAGQNYQDSKERLYSVAK